jgi:hypothetical protein
MPAVIFLRYASTITISAFEPPCVNPVIAGQYRTLCVKNTSLTLAVAHPTIWQPSFMYIDIQQTPHHVRLAVGVQ